MGFLPLSYKNDDDDDVEMRVCTALHCFYHEEYEYYPTNE